MLQPMVPRIYSVYVIMQSEGMGGWGVGRVCMYVENNFVCFNRVKFAINVVG